jgi:nitrite reductase (NADH) large subunit
VLFSRHLSVAAVPAAAHAVRRAAVRAASRIATPAGAPRGTGARQTLVVIGNGMVGHRLCRQLVERGATSRYAVTVFGEERHLAYDRVHLTDLLVQRDEESLRLAPRQWYDEQGIDVRLGDPVTSVDRDAQVVRAASGAAVRYDVLVFATGSSPFVPRIDGTDGPGIFVYRTIEDLRAIKRHAQSGGHAAVIGGGLLGLEAARALGSLGLATTVVEVAAGLMPSQLTQAASKVLERAIAVQGISVRTAAPTARITANQGRQMLHLAGGEQMPVDLVVIAAGIRPRTELAEACGVARSPAGGIVVDDRLRSSDPNIYAIGECASHRSRVYGLVAPGYNMADVVAENLAGGSAVFAGAAVTARLKLLDIDVATTGRALDSGRAVVFESADVYRLLRVERGRLVGALGVGCWPAFGRVQDAVLNRRRIWPWQAARFQRTGELGVRETGVATWAAEAVVCNCLSITKGHLAAARAGGCATVAALAELTGASTICGACRPLLAELAGVPDARPRLRAGLFTGSVVALAAALLIMMAPPVPFADTMQAGWRLDRLWRDNVLRQISGFTLLGLSMLAAVISVRKRWRRMTFGSFPLWRIVHVGVGVLTLAVLAAHTGFRVGERFNLVLMAAFLSINFVGALAGGLTAFSERLDRRVGRTLRTALVLAHGLAVWPLPILVGFHVLAVYYF